MTQKTVECPLCEATSINFGLHLPNEAYNTCMWCCYPLCRGYVGHPGRVNAVWLRTMAVLAELPLEIQARVQAAAAQRRYPPAGR